MRLRWCRVQKSTSVKQKHHPDMQGTVPATLLLTYCTEQCTPQRSLDHRCDLTCLQEDIEEDIVEDIDQEEEDVLDFKNQGQLGDEEESKGRKAGFHVPKPTKSGKSPRPTATKGELSQ